MEYAMIGWPGDGSTLQLDHRVFAYAGKFVRSTTGKAVARSDDEIVAAASFSPDRADDDAVRVRTVTVRRDRQGEGIGSRLLAGLRAELLADRYDRVRIAVNNPHAYQAAYRAGFGYTGEESGLAELVLVAPRPQASPGYTDGMTAYAERDELPEAMRTYAESRRSRGPPDPVSSPTLRG